jgi:C1A family cysteine protease
MFEHKGLGRREPTDWSHVLEKPLKALGRQTIAKVEKVLILPTWHNKHDQGQEGACVGHGTTMAQCIINEHQVRRQGILNPYIRYNSWWLWDRAKETDSFPDTNPGDSNGTTVKAAAEVLKTRGHVLWLVENDPKSVSEESLDFGIAEARWATTVDEVRTAIATNTAVSIGVNWYSKFAEPEYINAEYWIGNGKFGYQTGGHCVCIYGASDERQAFRIKNSWGPEYPEVWLPYEALDRLIRENGEVLVATDR